MPVFDLFSKRQKRSRGEVPDVYIYDEIPAPLRVQIVQIASHTLGDVNNDATGNIRVAYKDIVEILRREYGTFSLTSDHFTARAHDYKQELLTFILQERDIERVLDAVEICFRYIDKVTRSSSYSYTPNRDTQADLAIEELNLRFSERGIGFRFENGEIIRIDSELLHAEVVKPALKLLSDRRFQGAQDEFLNAHEHYRSGNSKEALNEALKSIESLIKSICDSKKWPYKANATAADLIEICFEKGLIPPFWQSHFASLRSLLQGSVPTGRNKLGAHGQGSEIKTVPQHIVGYVMHMTAATIVFLAESFHAHP